MTRFVALGGVALMFLAACGGDDESDADADAVPETAGGEAGDGAADDVSMSTATTFRGELEDGSTLTVRLDVDESDPVIAPFAAFRAEAGTTEPVVWIVGSLDAPADYDDALGPPTGRFLTFLPPGADLIEDDATNPSSTFACGRLVDWFGTPTGDEAAALNETYMAVFDESCDGQSLQVVGEPGAVTDYAMVVEGESLPEFDAVYAGLLTELEPVE